uniref:RST domain-containing protein n=1 Tax=Rhizophora mucronata TaxID=61149 RepID=A0A2P2LM52_RHIMU
MLSERQAASGSGVFLGKAPTLSPSSTKTPRSPWMPFPMLFAAISNKVPRKDMALVTYHYGLFRVCRRNNSFCSFCCD